MSKLTKQIAVSVFVVLCTAIVTETRAEKNESLSVRQRRIITISAFTAIGNMQKLEAALNEGLDAGLTINEIKEIMIQTYAYAGFPRALNGIDMFLTVLDKRKAQGKKDFVGKDAGILPPDFDRTAYGNHVRNSLVGYDMTKRTSGYSVFAPVIDTFLVEHLFADIFVRDVLSYQDRELVTISILSVLAGVEPQLKSHMRISNTMGLSKSQLSDFTEVLKREVNNESAERAAVSLNTIFGITLPLNQNNAIKVLRNGKRVNAPAAHFTGQVTVESMFSSDTSNGYSGGIVNFQAGARTAWHTHPYGQTLIIISGHGLVQSEGGQIIEIFPGDVVCIPSNVRHWHGATSKSKMSHVAIAAPFNGETVQWMEQVSDEQYGK